MLIIASGLSASAARGQSIIYVDDDAPGDPGPNTPDVSDSLEDGSADHPFDAIQEAVDAAVAGDAVVISGGMYAGTGNKNLDFGGKAITVRSASGDPALCIIDCEGDGRGFYFQTGEGPDSVVEGLTITNGYVDESSPGGRYGGGIQCAYSEPTLSNCIFRGNRAYDGGGIDCYYCSPTIRNCKLAENTASAFGGGIFCYSSSPTLVECDISRNTAFAAGGGVDCWNDAHPTLVNCSILGNIAGAWQGDGTALGGGVHCYDDCSPMLINCLISGNAASGAYGGGGGVAFSYSDPVLVNCTIAGNTASDDGGGVFSNNLSTPTFTNCIVWDNAPYAMDLWASTPVVAYSAIQGGWAGEGNIVDDPLLTPDGYLTAGSPCIDAGDDAALPPDAYDLDDDGDTSEPIPIDIHGEARIDDDRVDMGADEFVDHDDDGLPAWWETHYFGTSGVADPDADHDGDLSATREEYERFASNPLGAPYYVDAVNGADAWDGLASAWDGVHGPKATLQAAMDAAGDGDSVLVLTGVYSGSGNLNLDFAGKGLLVRATAGSGQTAIDCGGAGPAISDQPLCGGFAHLDGFTIRNCLADQGPGLRTELAPAALEDCVITNNEALLGAGGIHVEKSSLTLDGVTLDLNSPLEPNGVIHHSHVHLDGLFDVAAGTVEISSSWFAGPGRLGLAEGTLLRLAGGNGDPPTVFRSDLRGLGDIQVDLGQSLYVEHGAVVDLSGEMGGGCADPGQWEDWGTIFVDGTLLVRDATIQNTSVEVSAADFWGAVNMINNDITLLEASAGYGGEFFIEGTATIRCNHITSYGDRYLDLDPDPSIPSEERPTVEENRIDVIITQGVGSERGEILELRATDSDCAPEGANPGCESGAFHAPGSPGFTADPSENWVLESLEIEPGAKLNLTDRQGFVFQDPLITTPETVYVKHLILRENATFNTALQALYYEQLTAEDGSQIIDVPLLGFSLKTIDMECEEEFGIRIRWRDDDPNDEQACECYGNCPDGEPPHDPTTCKEGSTTRLTDPASDNGLMEMRTQAESKHSASSVAAKGAFARAGDENIVVAFRYQFEQNPDAELVVYLSDDPDVSESLVELARVGPPAYGRGSIGSDDWALFYGTFPRGQLNFTRGTYVELELRGEDAVVWIDDFDPQIRCPSQCGDFAPPDGLDTEDFLVLMGEYGRSLDPFAEDAAKWCLDSAASFDQYVDLSDVFLWDTFLNGDALNACGTGYGGGYRSGAPRGGGTPTELPGITALVVAGKPNSVSDQRDYLYTVRPDGSELGDALDPASVPDPSVGFRSNTRLIQDGEGRVYQLHGTQGLILLDTAQVVIPPTHFELGNDDVYVGVTSIGETDFTGLPLLDVAFHPTDPTMAYVVPVLVIPEDTNPDAAICPYRAAAKLSLAEQPGGEYTVDLLKVYGTNPADDGCVNVTPVLGCDFILREPDVQRVREIEVDATGQNVLVLSAQGLTDNNDWLLVFDEATGDELRISAGGVYPGPTAVDCPAATGGGVPLPASPTAMTLSACSDQLYLTSSLANADPQDARTQVSVFDVQRNGNQITDLTLNRTIGVDANGVTGPDYGWGHMATITAFAEDPATCSLYVTGFTAPRVDPYLSTDDPLYEQLFGNGASIFTTPTLAVVPPGQTMATATELVCHDLALPVSAVLSIHEPGDCNNDGQVDLDDYAGLYNCLTGPTAELTTGCECFDLNTDDHVDLIDFAQLSSILSP